MIRINKVGMFFTANRIEDCTRYIEAMQPEDKMQGYCALYGCINMLADKIEESNIDTLSKVAKCSIATATDIYNVYSSMPDDTLKQEVNKAYEYCKLNSNERDAILLLFIELV